MLLPPADDAAPTASAGPHPGAGMWTVRYFKSKQYNWSGMSQQPSLLAKAKRGLLQFTPHSWDNFEWGVFSSPKRCLQVRPGALWAGGCQGRRRGPGQAVAKWHDGPSGVKCGQA